MTRGRLAVVLVVLLLLAGGLLWRLGTRTPPPVLPYDDDHRNGDGLEACIGCHNVDGPAPRSQRHPLDQRCFQCHQRAQR